MRPRHKTEPVHIRVLNIFVVLYRHAADVDPPFVKRNTLSDHNIGWAFSLGNWTLSVGRYVD